MTTKAKINKLIDALKLRVPEGALVGKPIRLLDFQYDIIIRGFFRRKTARAIISIARKNGKTALVAVIVIFALLGFRLKENSFIAVAARSRDQAAILFTYLHKMINMSPILSKLMHIREAKKEIVCHATGINLRCMSADATTAFGYSPALTIHDELGQVRGPRDAFYDAIETASGAHDDPLSIIISTQAPQDTDLLSVMIDDAKSNRDPSTVLFLHSTDADRDLMDKKGWAQSNPALGIFRNEQEFIRMAKRAKALPSAEATFRNLYLNQRVEVANPLVTTNVWKANRAEPDLEVFQRYPSWGALDLSARHDLTSYTIGCWDEDDVCHIYQNFWTPMATLNERSQRDRAPYDVWFEEGHIRTTPGKTVSYEHVARDIVAINESLGVDLQAVAYDRWRIDDFRRACERSNVELPLAPFGQGFKDMSPAIEALETALVDNKVRHGMHPVLTWNMANTFVSTDPAGNRKLNKQKATGRIDGAVTLVMVHGARNLAASSNEISILSL